jgi:transcriptional regulator with XRE-family HTH domain
VVRAAEGADMTGSTRARHVRPPNCDPVPNGHTDRLGALVRRERLSRGLSTRSLAQRAAVARSTVTRLEAAQFRPRRCLLSALALGLDPDQQRELLAQFIEAAGGADVLAPDGEWPHYRRKRLERGILAGTTPLPAAIARSLELHRRADALLRESMAILDRPGALDDAELLGESLRLHEKSTRLRDAAGPPFTLYVGGHRITAGIGYGLA